MSTRSQLPEGWRWFRLGDRNIAEISAGGTPKRSVHRYFEGNIPWAKIGDLTNSVKYISDTEEKISEEAIENSNAKIFPKGTVLVSMYGSIGKSAIAAVPIATNQAIVGIQVITQDLLPVFIYYFFILTQPRLELIGRGATQNNINAGHIKELEIPVPPLPVQERIVQILRKADEIRHKRQEAVAIADSTILSIFNEMFSGEVGTVEHLGKHLKETKYGTSQKLNLLEEGYPVLRIPNVVEGEVNTHELKHLEVDEDERDRLLLEKGDILLVRTNGNKNYVGRCAVFDLEGEYLFASYLIRLRVNQATLNPYFLTFFLNTSGGRREIDQKTRTSAGQYNINTENIRSIQALIPSLKLQKDFVMQLEQWKASKQRLTSGYEEANGIFSSLLSQSFTGELTGEWETANADLIAAKQRYSDRLPRLVLLSFLRDKIHRSQQADATVLVTALMKYLFLFQMEGAAQRRLYQFIPYHYGPFAKELYPDLEALQEEGLLTVDNGDETKTHLSLTNPEAVEQTLADLTHDLDPEITNLLTEDFTAMQADITTILNTYGALDHNTLLTTVYEKYPAYAQRSKVKNRRRTAKSSHDAESQDNEA
ncbi:MAG: restriction endonuclease subunit S [Lyngbya sp. HA4199-MV5]|jgi:type I restriction enzyme S subunit|nr:restriction endonuclease subunit S [Lyngbya sp. HA4199-MV5]